MVRYQSSVETFTLAGNSEPEAMKSMRDAVMIADEARELFLQECRASDAAISGHDDDSSTARSPSRPALCLTLGPYGATIPGAQEFEGLYPPPFGPIGSSDASGQARTTAFAANSSEEGAESVALLEERAELALAEFHLRRLLVFVEDDATWDRIDCVAFETVPLLREARAIKRAVGQLEAWTAAGVTGVMSDPLRKRQPPMTMKPWYISFNFPGPDGRCIQERWSGGPRIDLRTLVHDVFSCEGAVRRPAGIGINCTQPKFVSRLVKDMTESASELPRVERAPRLVVYPNGGLQYDADNQAWQEESESLGTSGNGWARHLLQSIREGLGEASATSDGAGSSIGVPWSGIMVGGCCKVGPGDIGALRELINA